MSRGAMGLAAGLVVGIILGLILAAAVPQASAAPGAADSGKYQLMDYGPGKQLLLADTQTGKVWIYRVTEGGFKPEKVFGLHE